ncbi:MAG: type I DNA topoisomerase [Chloroflexota bacterium]
MSDSTVQAYCVKCKDKREMSNPEATYTKTGTPGTRGECPVCGTGMFRMGETDAHADVPKPKVVASPKRKKSKSKKKKSKRRKRNVGKLVIVESPAKAKSIGTYLGKGYTVMASKGHVRDLLVTQLSVDVENDFEPKYRVPNKKRDVVKEIKAAVEDADEVYLATDPDREGEAIAWHLMAAADIDDDAKRVVFHEITKDAVKEAFNHPREIDMSLVNAQQARRILDRLVGYNITELLWDKVRNRLSAGRVQSIALRMVVDREREIEAFNPVEYWSLEAELSKQPENGADMQTFTAKLAKIEGENFEIGSEEEMTPHVQTLEQSIYKISSIKRGKRRRKPSAPFTTSSLQQEASRRLGFNARRTMRAAQKLYEGVQLPSGETSGLITYMRTDSLNISPAAQQEARDYIGKTYGDEFMPKKAPTYKTKSKGAQEAHEAIRPTKVMRTPDSLKGVLKRDDYRLYELIWLRFVASQMSNAIYDTIRVEIDAGLNDDNMPYLFRSSGSRINFMGFLAVYEDSKDEDDTTESDEGRMFPIMEDGELLRLLKLLPQQHFTQPPPRYTEASLVKALEEYGIGRPSTYAPTVAVIQDRDYVNKEAKRLVPTDVGKIVSELLVEYFSDEMQYEFTAKMEGELDDIAESDGEWRPMLRSFYTPFENRLENARANMPTVKQEEKIGRICTTCNEGELVIRYGRYGKFIGCENYPECRHTEQYVEYVGMTCPDCGEEHEGELVVKKTRRGRTFYGCSRYPECEYSTWKLPKNPNASDDGDTEGEDEEENEVLTKTS